MRIESIFEVLIMTTHDTERTPLLAKTGKANEDGPLECHEISCTTRYGILAALWAGIFLCVSRSLVRQVLMADGFQNLNRTWWRMGCDHFADHLHFYSNDGGYM